MFDANEFNVNGEEDGLAITFAPEYNAYPVTGPAGIVNVMVAEEVLGVPEIANNGGSGGIGNVEKLTGATTETPPGPVETTLNV